MILLVLLFVSNTLHFGDEDGIANTLGRSTILPAALTLSSNNHSPNILSPNILHSPLTFSYLERTCAQTRGSSRFKMAARRLEPFNGMSSVTEYLERLEQCFIMDDIEDNVDNRGKRKAFLLGSLSASVYSQLRDVCSPALPNTKTYAEIVTLLKSRYEKKKIVVAERYLFHLASQKEGETVLDYACRLQKLASSCNFGQFLNDALRDRLICGIKEGSIRETLLSKEHTWNEALELAQAGELAILHNRKMYDAPSSSQSVHRMKSKGKSSKVTQQQKPSVRKCFRCEGSHSPDECYHKTAECRYCHFVGHIERACLKKKKKNKKVHSVNLENNSTVSDNQSPLKRLSLHRLHRTPAPIMISVSLCNVPIQMELDTGSAVSIISNDDYVRFQERAPLRSTSTKFETYTGELVIPLGITSVSVRYDGKDYRDMSLYVVKNSVSALIGRDWLEIIPIDWASYRKSVKSVNECNNVESLDSLLKKHGTLFSSSLGTLKGIQAKLNVKPEAQPKFHKARPVPYSKREYVNDALSTLEAEGVIERVDHSEWACPIVTPWKRSNQVRICGDFKVSVNPYLDIDQYPLPRIEDIFASLSGGTKFTKLDLFRAYHNMEVHPDSRPYLTINTQKGLYRYCRLPEGIASAPALWQKAMDQVLQGIPHTQCYLDDILVTGSTDQEHLQNLALVLQRLEQANLRLNVNKCAFMQDSIEYCGHVIDAKGLHPTQEKVEAILSAPVPKSVSEVKSLCGFISYYRKFIPDCASVMYPLTQLLKDGEKFKWESSQQEAFDQIKKIISSNVVLCHYDPKLDLRLACDSSSYGIGAVLSHVLPDGSERPIAFASCTLSDRERGYSQIDKEALAIVWGIQRFNMYLEGRHFTLITDHRPLTHIFSPTKGISITQSARLQRWAVRLMNYNYDVIYRNTNQHSNADFLSRLPLLIRHNLYDDNDDIVHVMYNLTVDALPVTVSDLRNNTANDPVLSRVLKATKEGWSNAMSKESDLYPYYCKRDELSIIDNCIMWGQRVVVPKKLHSRILKELHVAHLGIVKMKGVARSHIWWPGIDKEIESLSSSCDACKSVLNTPACTAKHHHWEVPKDPWHRIHCDFAGPFMNHMFLIVVDASTKWPEIVIMKSTNADNTIKELRTIFSREGLPSIIVTDNGPQWTSSEFASFCKSNNINHVTTAAYRPQSNGLAERMVQSFKKTMKSFDYAMPIQQKVDTFLLSYRTSPHCITGEIPALRMRHKLRTLLDTLKPDIRQSPFKRETPLVKMFYEGQSVQFRWYNSPQKWRRGVITSEKGKNHYEIICDKNVYRRHAEQIIAVKDSDNSVVQNEVPSIVNNGESQMSSISQQLINVQQPCVTDIQNDTVTAVPDNDISVENINESEQNVEVTVEPRRSTRERKPPTFLKDFVK